MASASNISLRNPRWSRAQREAVMRLLREVVHHSPEAALCDLGVPQREAVALVPLLRLAYESWMENWMPRPTLGSGTAATPHTTKRERSDA